MRSNSLRCIDEQHKIGPGIITNLYIDNMAASKEDMLRVAGAVGYDIPDEHIDDYTTLLGRMKGALETISAMDGQQHCHDVSKHLMY